MGGMGRCWSKGTKLQFCRMNKSRDLIYRCDDLLNALLNTGNMLKVDFRGTHHTHKMVNYVRK